MGLKEKLLGGRSQDWQEGYEAASEVYSFALTVLRNQTAAYKARFEQWFNDLGKVDADTISKGSMLAVQTAMWTTERAFGQNDAPPPAIQEYTPNELLYAQNYLAFMVTCAINRLRMFDPMTTPYEILSEVVHDAREFMINHDDIEIPAVDKLGDGSQIVVEDPRRDQSN